MDEFDRASELEQAHLEFSLRFTMNKVKPKQVANPDGSYPVTECDCGEEIPIERLKHGYVNCVHCQTEIERNRNGMGRTGVAR